MRAAPSLGKAPHPSPTLLTARARNHCERRLPRAEAFRCNATNEPHPNKVMAHRRVRQQRLAGGTFLRAADLIEAAADEQPAIREAVSHPAHIALDAHGRILSIAPAVAERLGGRNSLVGKRLLHRVVGVERASLASMLLTVRTSRAFVSARMKFRRPDGTHVGCEMTLLRAFDIARGGIILVYAAQFEEDGGPAWTSTG